MSAKTIFEKVGSVLKKLFTSSTLEHQIETTITVAAPIAEGIIGMVDPPLEPIVAGVLNTVKSDLATIVYTAQSAKIAPGSSAAQTVIGAANAVKENLSSLLSVAEIKNSGKVTEITTAVNTLVGEMDAIAGAVAA